MGDDVVVVGIVRKHRAMERLIEPILVNHFSKYERKEEPKQVLTIAKAMKARPMGKLVRVRGRITLFIGAERNATLI